MTDRQRSLQDCVDELAELCERSVELTTPAIQVMNASAQLGEIDERRTESILRRTPPPEPIPWMVSNGIYDSRGPVRLPPHEGYGMLGRVVFPLRQADELLGFLWVIDSPRLDDAVLRQAAPIVAEATHLLAGDDSAPADSQLRDAAFREITTAVPGALDRAIAAGLLPAAGAPVVHCCAFAGTAKMSQAARAFLTKAINARSFLAGELPGENADAETRQLCLVEVPRSGTPTAELVAQLTSALAAVGATGVGYGVARADLGLGGELPALAETIERARFAAAISELTSGSADAANKPVGTIPVGTIPASTNPAPLDWAELGSWRLLRGWGTSRGVIAKLCPQAAQLIAADGALWATALAYLDNARNVQATSAQLHIHRATLHYRLRAVRDLIGPDFLDDGWQTPLLHVCLRLNRALEQA